MTIVSEKIRNLRRKRKRPRLFASSVIVLMLLTACSDNYDTPSISEVAINLPRALVTATVADCLTGTLTAGTRSTPLVIVGDQASATISSIPPGPVDVFVDFFCADIKVASASQTVTVVAGQNLSVVFSDSDFTILLVWDVTSWDEGQWAD